MRFALAVAILLLIGNSATRGAETRDDLKAGLVGEYFDWGQGLEDFPTLEAGRKPTVRKIDAQLNWDATEGKFAGTNLEDHFYVRWAGVLRVPRDGKYALFTESDDGSRLWIDGKEIVSNGGLHAMEEKKGELDLKAGDHEIKVDLFENEGYVGLKVSWEGPDLAKEIIPAKALFHKKDKDLDKD